MKYLSISLTKLDPWLFVIIIIDYWGIGASKRWKYVDDTSLAETIEKGNTSSIQDSVDDLTERALASKSQLNQSKCKKLRIGFTKSIVHIFNPIKINDTLGCGKQCHNLGLKYFTSSQME